MAVLAKPCDNAFVVSSEHKEDFLRKSKESKSFEKLMARSSHITAKVNINMSGQTWQFGKCS